MIRPARDAFVPSGLWKPKGEAKSDTGERLASTGSFRAKHKLSVVMMAKRGGMVVLDGKPVKLNQKVDGFTLVEVHSAMLSLKTVRRACN